MRRIGRIGGIASLLVALLCAGARGGEEANVQPGVMTLTRVDFGPVIRGNIGRLQGLVYMPATDADLGRIRLIAPRYGEIAGAIEASMVLYKSGERAPFHDRFIVDRDGDGDLSNDPTISIKAPESWVGLRMRVGSELRSFAAIRRDDTMIFYPSRWMGGYVIWDGATRRAALLDSNYDGHYGLGDTLFLDLDRDGEFAPGLNRQGHEEILIISDRQIQVAGKPCAPRLRPDGTYLVLIEPGQAPATPRVAKASPTPRAAPRTPATPRSSTPGSSVADRGGRTASTRSNPYGFSDPGASPAVNGAAPSPGAGAPLGTTADRRPAEAPPPLRSRTAPERSPARSASAERGNPSRPTVSRPNVGTPPSRSDAETLAYAGRAPATSSTPARVEPAARPGSRPVSRSGDAYDRDPPVLSPFPPTATDPVRTEPSPTEAAVVTRPSRPARSAPPARATPSPADRFPGNADIVDAARSGEMVTLRLKSGHIYQVPAYVDQLTLDNGKLISVKLALQQHADRLKGRLADAKPAPTGAVIDPNGHREVYTGTERAFLGDAGSGREVIESPAPRMPARPRIAPHMCLVTLPDSILQAAGGGRVTLGLSRDGGSGVGYLYEMSQFPLEIKAGDYRNIPFSVTNRRGTVVLTAKIRRVSLAGGQQVELPISKPTMQLSMRQRRGRLLVNQSKSGGGNLVVSHMPSANYGSRGPKVEIFHPSNLAKPVVQGHMEYG